MDGEYAVNEHLLLYLRKYVSEQVYQVYSATVEYIRDHEEEVKLLGVLSLRSHSTPFRIMYREIQLLGLLLMN